MPSSRHHAEWLSLVEVSGPFLTMPVLQKVFPQGLDAHDPDHVRILRVAFDEWEDARDTSLAIHRAWIDFVLKHTLGLPGEVLAEGQAIPASLKATLSEKGETLRPDIVVKNPDGGSDAGKARLLIQVYPPAQGLEKAVPGRHWKASPATRMMELLHATDVRLGLVTNGEHWMLVDAPRGETTGFASWYAGLWMEEPLTLQAFRSLLGVSRFFSVPDDETLEAMLKESASNQQEVTDRLGYQVREAVEEIIRSLDRIDQGENRTLLAGVSESDLYEAALTVMMRLVFLFSAEERGLLLLGDALYDEHYAVSTLVAKLQEAADQTTEEVLERRNDAWVRLLSTFRAVFSGIRHDRLKLLPYRGKLFDPDRFPFLEGRKPGSKWETEAANPLPIDNRTVLHLLRSLQYLELQGEARRLSFRALDIEQIGHVYEGLLDHTARRATEPMLSLRASKGDEPEIALAELETRRLKGEAELVKFLKDETGRSENALRRDWNAPVEGEALKALRAACGNDDALLDRVRPFSALVRRDTFDRFVVIREGSFFVTTGTDRRSSGTHYTPRSLTEPIVQHTLEPLVYVGPAEGTPKEAWKLRSAKDILDLKVCDMACGSGAFLVQACRYLSERLVEAWDDAEARHPGVPGITPEGDASTGAAREQIIPADTDERLAFARRLVAQRCLYGVDKNPLAVEMAKLSLWLLTLGKDKPFTFLDHAIRCGDSLVGVDEEQLKTFSLDRKGIGVALPNFLGIIPKIMDATRHLRVRLEKIADDSAADVEEKQRLFDNIRFQTKRLTYAADRLLAASWKPAKPAERLAMLRDALGQVEHRIRDVDPDQLEAEGREARRVVGCPQPFHWAIEFPEVFLDRSGFDAVVGNPPFLRAGKISDTFSNTYRDFLVQTIALNTRGAADYCSYFFLRGWAILRSSGKFGLLATNTISQGDTREVGLQRLISLGCTIYRAVSSLRWTGVASIEVAIVWGAASTGWFGVRDLDGEVVSEITSTLSPSLGISSMPGRLKENNGIAFKGHNVYGVGFILSGQEASEILNRQPVEEIVIKPFLNASDLNTSPNQLASRWVINFQDWPLNVCSKYTASLELIRSRVKPERDQNPRKARRENWWRFGDYAGGMERAIAGLDRVIVIGAHSRTLAFVVLSRQAVFSHALIVIASPKFSDFAILQSSIHEAWARQYASSLKGDLRYTPSDCFETFPFPIRTLGLEVEGELFHRSRTATQAEIGVGLTQLYDLFHDPKEDRESIMALRLLHARMDRAVIDAYGWPDVELEHGFHFTKAGLRFTISNRARQLVMRKLLELNKERPKSDRGSRSTNKEGGHSRKRGKPASTDSSEGINLFD